MSEEKVLIKENRYRKEYRTKNKWGDPKTEEEYDVVRILKDIGMLSLLLFVIIPMILSTFYTVPERHVGIVKRFGEAIEQTNPGIHFKFPIVDSIENMEVGTRQYTETFSVATMSLATEDKPAELQLPSKTTIKANWNIPKAKALAIYKQYGGLQQFEDRILDNRIGRTVKANFSKNTIEYAVANRELLREAIIEDLAKDLGDVHVTLSDVSIYNIVFSPTIKEAISNKQEAKLQAEAENYKLEQQQLYAQQQVNTGNATRDSNKAIADGKAYAIEVEAQAQAEAIKKIGLAEASAIKAKVRELRGNPLYVDLVREQQWNGSYVTTMLGQNSNMLLETDLKLNQEKEWNYKNSQ